MQEDKFGLQTQNQSGLRYMAFKAGVDARGKIRAQLIDTLRRMKEQDGGAIGPVRRIAKSLREKRRRDRHRRI